MRGKSYGAGLYLYQQAYETPGASCQAYGIIVSGREKRLPVGS